MTNLKPLHGKIILKLETASVKRTNSGIIFDTAFENKSYSFGHVYKVDEETTKRHGLKVGDRVVFEKDRAETTTYKSKETASMIDVVLVFIHPDDILAIVPEEKTVMDYLQN